jgi:molybdenum cofactor biosynthesis protein B
MAPVSAHEHKAAAPAAVRCAVLTVSDTRTAGTDLSGPRIRSLLEEHGHVVARHDVVPDDRDRIASAVDALVHDGGVDAVIVNGGTGLAPRDVTVDALAAMFTRNLDGFGELFRMLSYEQIGAAAMLSRAAAGVIGTTLVFALPGSPGACELALKKLICPELGHAVSLANPEKRRR